MAVAVDSPFILNITNTAIPIPSGGTFVAGRRRRINNDPYGGEGYVWEDITVPVEAEEGTPIEAVQNSENKNLNLPDQSIPEQPIELRSVAAKRLDQLRQHLIDLSIFQRTSQLERPFQGYSIDNVHLSMAGLQDWQSPQGSCAQHSNRVSPSSPSFNQEWQQFMQNAIFGSGLRPKLAPRTTGNPGAFVALPTLHQSKPCPQRLDNEPTQSCDLRPELAFEMDVHCNSWSSLMAQRRRTIAAVAW